jgi:PEGA domain-containing protein
MCRLLASILLFVCCVPVALHGQSNAKTSDQRGILQQILLQIYQPAEVGKKLMGVGADTDVRRAGTIIVIQREGLWGSFLRSEIASSSIHGLKADLYRGHRDYALPAGERLYVISVHVGEDTIDIGMLSARPIGTQRSAARVWTVATFYFQAETLATADKDTVLRDIDAWFLPEGRTSPTTRSTAASSASASSLAPQSTPPATSNTNRTESLQTGMTREEILAAIGKPQRETTFQSQTWLHYSAMVVLLKDGKLSDVQETGPPTTARVTFRSDPDGAEILLDGHLVGTTPSTLDVPAGNHQLIMRVAGRQDWVRHVLVLAGSETHFDARFDKP